MCPDDKISSAQTDGDEPVSSENPSVQPPISPEQSLQAQNQLPAQPLPNDPCMPVNSQEVERENSEIHTSEQDLQLERANQPPSADQSVSEKLQDEQHGNVEIHVSPEQNLLVGKQPPADQPKVKCVAGDFDEQPENIEIHVVPPNESHVEKRVENPAENRPKESRNIAVQRDDDTIDELSDALPPVTVPSPEEPKPEDSCMVKFLKRRYEVAMQPLQRIDYVYYYSVVFIMNLAVLIFTLKYLTDPAYLDVCLSFMIVSATCCSMTFMFERGKFSSLEKKLCNILHCDRCCSRFNRHEAQPPFKQSQYVTSAEGDEVFQHEVADVENINPADLPPTFSRKQESLDSHSPDRPDSPIVISADFHKENVDSPEHFSEGACGYSPPSGEGTSQQP